MVEFKNVPLSRLPLTERLIPLECQSTSLVPEAVFVVVCSGVVGSVVVVVVVGTGVVDVVGTGVVVVVVMTGVVS